MYNIQEKNHRMCFQWHIHSAVQMDIGNTLTSLHYMCTKYMLACRRLVCKNLPHTHDRPLQVHSCKDQFRQQGNLLDQLCSLSKLS